MTEVDKLLKLELELEDYKMMMGQAADMIMENDVSSHPIFIIHQQLVEIGIPLADKDKIKGNWSVNASSLEELFAKQIIEGDKIEKFKETYKDPKLFICLFVLSELGAQFIFIPRKKQS